ncbi:MAG: RNA-directed DNA polymerase [Gammaproteobacteria bacterium]|nr:RNA-directed DNA polymerase [Gammaproteobacteria bacterium]
MDLLREEYVLVQAWKKTANYIRHHNWYADTLDLDRTAINLPTFIGELRERLQSETWQNDPLRIVPAPKTQRWRVREGAWEPAEKGTTAARLRPLAHVSLADQVLATALMLCLADRVETMQGDPRLREHDLVSRKRVVSYGNRLFCDEIVGELRHRWGSARLYRAYYEDYRAFLRRPELAAESMPLTDDVRTYVVHADLRQFYDRVRPDRLSAAINRVRRDSDDSSFFSLATTVLDWGWHPRDATTVGIYAKQAELDDFERVALPQGLVASGFFANVVLLAFDEALRAMIGSEIAKGMQLADSCRYVDDLRILIRVDANSAGSLQDLEDVVSEWLGQTLSEHAIGLSLSHEKTQIAALGGDERPLVRQSAKMNRLQSAVSCGFDALGGEEILDAIQGLMRAQEALSVGDDSGWQLSPVPDVRDETVARFGAARYRTTFRSIRPLLQDDDARVEPEDRKGGARNSGQVRVARTRQELDEDARAFALGLIQRWINDPSNVRLLRIGLDLWPDVELLREVLALLRPFTEKGGRRKEPRRVAWYCLAEVLRAGATETGLVPDVESLPSGIILESYREQLREEATRLVGLPGPTIPWYLRQQALLFLAVSNPAEAPVARTGTVPETRHYRELIRFLRGEGERIRSTDFATLAVLARRAFVDCEHAIELTEPGLTVARVRQLAMRDPSLLVELIDTEHGPHVDVTDLPARTREDLCLSSESSEGKLDTLSNVVLNTHPNGTLRNELSLLRFAMAFLKQWEKQESPPRVIAPGQVTMCLVEDSSVARIDRLRILSSRADPSGSLYEPPSWCEAHERWRFQLGFLLRFILAGQPDFTRLVRRASWKESESCYRAAESHWYQRLYGLYNGQSAFGDDWLPITDWVERFLLALLRWPGCRSLDGFGWVAEGTEEARARIGQRITELEERRGNATGTLILPLLARRPTLTNADRPLRACLVQTVVPADDDFQPKDLVLNDPATRRRHRNHLSAALAAVERMLALRGTHKGREGQLDWLILPELAVHPNDIRTHLVPFARAHRAIILTGLTYQELIAGEPFVNSALWVIPEWSDAFGLQITTRRQGKAHLAPTELEFNSGGADVVQGFRPCQWLIGYPWCRPHRNRPVWLTAAVCYDATDLGLAADLRDLSDVLAIPALNKDVKTFDQMALALHYHMFQLVVVANNGKYGGSNAYWPRSDPHIRQVFHTHGQPQASISFLEVDDIGAFLKRHDVPGTKTADWKHPPAGTNTTP